ncbi:putative disease resistance protein At4g19050 [Olea europaea var. sylvestris]|uniref:putative disease resistance protein At4g19050 n=1 Tax=Olea europaea var. sylvestris TaxID=158386 RepID=UPI000C1CEB08|nr:putative disease resistance protein At4g19050 [Olea europaea var. sylvestris]
MVPKGIRVFHNLKCLDVESCTRLKYLFPTSMINSFMALETLCVSFCGEIEEVFGREKEEVVKEGMTSNIVFHELRRIELIGLPRFKMFCSHNYEDVLPSLDLLRIEDCPMMTKFCSGQLNAPKLKYR